MNNRLNLGDDEFAYEPQPIVVRIGRREVTLTGCLNSFQVSNDPPYPELYPYTHRQIRDDRTASLKFSNVTIEERWVHDDPHIVEFDRHGKRLRCECKCSRCFRKDTDRPCICPGCKCNGAEVEDDGTAMA